MHENKKPSLHLQKGRRDDRVVSDGKRGSRYEGERHRPVS